MEITDCSVVGAYLHIISCLISKGKYFNFEATMINAKKKKKIQIKVKLHHEIQHLHQSVVWQLPEPLIWQIFCCMLQNKIRNV